MEAAKIKWESMGDDGNYLEMSDELTMKKSWIPERMSLWSNIFKNVLDDYYKLFN